MKVNIVISGNFMPQIVDDWKVKHDAAIIITDEKQQYRICLGLDKDDQLSKDYMPFWHRTLDLDKIIYLRDHLTKLIEVMKEE